MPGRSCWPTAGQLNEAPATTRAASDAAQRAGRHESAAGYQTAIAVWDALYGNLDAAKRTAASVLTVARGRDLEYGAGFAMALAGDAAEAEALAAGLERRFPQDTSVKYAYVPTIRAVLALKRRELARASDLLQVNVPYELAVPGLPFNLFFGAMYPVYVRGEVLPGRRQGQRRRIRVPEDSRSPRDCPGQSHRSDGAGSARPAPLRGAGEADKARAAYDSLLHAVEER